MPVAKSFQKYTLIGEPYKKNGRQYIVIRYADGHDREVRWYTDAEYAKLYPAENPSTASQTKILRPLKDVLGFSKGYITIFKGDTYALLDWFREEPKCRYHKIFGWYVISEEELPEIPAGISPIQLKWEDVSVPGEDTLKSEAAIKEHINSLIYEPTSSEWQGEIGDRIEKQLTVTKVIPLDTGFFGPSTFHLFVDTDGNEYSWTTSSKTLEVGSSYLVRGSIKELKIYHNSKQTVLTRCRVS